MSATFKLSKQKLSQHDLRKMMNEQREKSKSTGKIDSPLAKYNDLGQLTCVLCQSVVRSEDVWKVHINAKQHKQNVENAKKLKEQTNNFKTKSATKRPASDEASTFQVPPPPKQLKGILKNSRESEFKKPETFVPSQEIHINAQFTNFYNATLQKTSIRTDLLNIKSTEESAGLADPPSTDVNGKDDVLPEGFFDDPIKDAKARNLEYKNPIEEEWERFQREIKTASNASNAIIAEDQEESTTERQIDEIDEQIRNWSRILRLEKQKEEVVDKEKQTPNVNVENGANPSDDDSDNDDNFHEFLDWRSKKSH